MDIDKYFPAVDETAAWLKKMTSTTPKIAVVLSGGLDSFLNDMNDKIEASYKDIPNFPTSQAEGHVGKLVFGNYFGKELIVMQGRFHYYEGHPPHVIVFPYFVLAKLGVDSLITTNAVGGVNKNFKPGDVMMVTDHINFMGMNPLRGIAVQRKTDQFTSMTNAYDSELQNLSRRIAGRLGIELKEGVYAATSGPSYETKAEVLALRGMGADAVGMSTVPSVIAANFLNMRVLTYSCIANAGADLHTGQMTHKEVLDAMNAIAHKVVKLLQEVVKEL